MRESIIKCAAESFLKLGFKSVTMDDISSCLSISKKTLYKYFSNKHDLVLETSLSFGAKISKAICSVMSDKLNPIEENFKIKQVVNEHLKKFSSSPMYQLKKYYPDIFKSLRSQKFEVFNTCMRNNLERGMRDGYYRKEINVDNYIQLYFLLVEGIRENETFELNNNSMSCLDTLSIEYHMRAVSTEKGIEILEKQLEKLNNEN